MTLAVPVGAPEVESVLRPWLGSLFLSSNRLSQELAAIARDYAPYRQTMEELHNRLESRLLTGLSRCTGGSMCVVMDDYRTRRLSLRDVRWMTDDVMGLVFDTLSPFSANFERLNDYSLHVESLAALQIGRAPLDNMPKPQWYSLELGLSFGLHPPPDP